MRYRARADAFGDLNHKAIDVFVAMLNARSSRSCDNGFNCDRCEMLRSTTLLLAFTIFSVAVAAVISLDERGSHTYSSRRRPYCDDLHKLLIACNVSVSVKHLPTEKYRVALGADEILYAEFGGDRPFELYIARWKTDNPYAFEAGDHPPDLCWPHFGWKMMQAASNVELSPLITNAQTRVFSSEKHSQNVAFWCVSGGRFVNIPVRAFTPNEPRTGRRIVTGSAFLNYWFGTNESELMLPYQSHGRAALSATRMGETYFVRLNSAEPLVQVVELKMFREVMPLFQKLGIAR